MSNKQPDMRRDALLRRALVPKGFRPTKDVDIEKLLDTIGEQPISEEMLQRMLRKVNGQEAIFPDRATPAPTLTTELSPQEHEAYALCRSKNKPLPPDLAAKVKALEAKAGRQVNSDGESSCG